MQSLRLIIGVAATAGALMAGTAPADAASPDAAPAGAVPAKAAVKHQAWSQKDKCWCVPASVQLSLRTFGIKRTQDTLAARMGTSSSSKDCGTSGKKASPVYNDYLRTKGYRQTWANGQNPTTLMDKVSYDVGVLHKAVPLGIWGKNASWIKARKNFGHAVSVRGYDKAKGTFVIWDPARKSYGGHHTVSAKDLAKASQKNGLFYVTKR